MKKASHAPIHRTLSLSYLGVLLIGMGLAAVLAWFTVESLYLDNQRENLLAQARLTAAALQGLALPDQAVEPYSQTSNVAPGIHTRILGEGGGVILSLPLPMDDTPLQTPLEENTGYTSPAELLKRPEIQQALKGQPATAIRRVAAAGNRRVLYAAAPIVADSSSPAQASGATGIVYLAMPLPPAGLPARALVQLGGALLLAVLLAGAAGTLIARRIARPIEQIAKSALAVSAGDLNQRLPVESAIEELNNLGQAFNIMTESLRQSEQARNAFIADVTHELRTPLTVIKGTIETLEDGALDDLEGRGPLLASMSRESERLIRLVNDLLLLTRADAGSLRMDLRPLDLVELARNRCAHLSPLAAHRRLELRVAGRETDPEAGFPVLADTDRTAEVLDNLLDNAMRYAPEGSVVTVRLERSGKRVECTVSDCGPGIPAQHLPFIFERFYRVEVSRDRHSGGAGLGLAITRALVQAQGGDIHVRSAEGRGTDFTFWLPGNPSTEAKKLTD
jgi:two-component system sensor histidine kinase BaeS